MLTTMSGDVLAILVFLVVMVVCGIHSIIGLLWLDISDEDIWARIANGQWREK